MTATLPTRTAVTTCAVPGRTHQADTASRLCTSHLEQLAGWLHDIEREVALLDAQPSFQTNWNDSRGGSLASHQSPARIGPLVHTDRRYVPADELTGLAGLDDTLSVFHILHKYASMVRHERNLADCDGRPTVPMERQLLSRHLDWITTQPWVGDMWNDIRKLVNQLQAVNNTGPLHVGSCPECGGRLHITEPRYTSGSNAAGNALWAAECDREAVHRWEGSRLLRLRIELDEQQKDRR